jgi:hypothetical protein
MPVQIQLAQFLQQLHTSLLAIQLEQNILACDLDKELLIEE